jgi:predicted Zn-dependent protease with MMP-like domain
MNRRIRELAEQAGIDFFNSIDPEFHSKEYCEAWTEQQQKFAELIVRECADLTRWTEHDMSVEQRIRLSIYQEIKSHFGVE